MRAWNVRGQAEIMANPQKENGYTGIANELVKAIYSTNFNATQLRIILFVMRYTYGFSRKSHAMSISFITKGTGISRRYISQELGKLIECNVIQVINEHTTTESRVISINKNFDQWSGYRTILPQVNNPSTDEQLSTTTGEQSFTTTDEQLFHQERKNKENIKKGDSHDEFFDKIWRLYPNKKGKGSVSKTTRKKLEAIGEDSLVMAIKNYSKYCETEKSWYQPMYGSTFFNGRYMDYLPTSTEEKPKHRERMPVREMTEEEIAQLIESKNAKRGEGS